MQIKLLINSAAYTNEDEKRGFWQQPVNYERFFHICHFGKWLDTINELKF